MPAGIRTAGAIPAIDMILWNDGNIRSLVTKRTFLTSNQIAIISSTNLSNPPIVPNGTKFRFIRFFTHQMSLTGHHLPPATARKIYLPDRKRKDTEQTAQAKQNI